MQKNNYIVATVKSWNFDNFNNLKKNVKGNWFLIKNKKDLSFKKITKIRPKFIFFPHWNHKVDNKIVENFECVCFHETNLPFGRGGSPIQNLILRGLTKTKITAFRMNKFLDAGPIYCKYPLSLSGSAEEILRRSSNIIFKIIIQMCKKKIHYKDQKGKIVNFKRRKPIESQLPLNLSNLTKIYDYIRMLDAEGYPNAYINYGKHIIKFKDAKFKKDCIFANVKIKKKNEI